MQWFKRNSRQDLFRAHTGKALIRSAARQVLALEISISIRTGRRERRALALRNNERETNEQQPPSLLTSYGDEKLKEVKVAKHIKRNPFLERYATVIDNLALSSFPPEIDNDIIIHMSD